MLYALNFSGFAFISGTIMSPAKVAVKYKPSKYPAAQYISILNVRGVKFNAITKLLCESA